MTAPEFLAVGHVTRDLFPDGSCRPGGTALYAAATASRLGVRAALLTAGRGPDAVRGATTDVGSSETLSAIDWVVLPADIDTTFENRDERGVRQQWLHAVAPRITRRDVPARLRSCRMVHLGPVADELDLDLLAAFQGAKIVATPQGWMRAWEQPLPAPVAARAFSPPPVLLARLTALVLSIEDVSRDEAAVAAYAAACPIVVVTRGAAGATLFVGGRPSSVPAFPAAELDATGAGDVFAAAFLVGLDETGDPVASATSAARIAAASVEGVSISAIPTRAEVRSRT
jgi:sugar/nucleoside kinase (ribokinase family)